MNSGNLNLTQEDILEKEFKIDTRGYRLKEVDQFLDEIIGDYENYNEVIKQMTAEKEELLNEIMTLKQEIRNLKTAAEITKTDDKEVTNMDLLRRVSNLEKIVYGKDE